MTRAVWVYPDGEQYAVFAGGTRMDAAGQAGFTEIPVLIHEGFAVEQIVRLSEEDNENDEYHTPVPLPEVWASYKQLYEGGLWFLASNNALLMPRTFPLVQ